MQMEAFPIIVVSLKPILSFRDGCRRSKTTERIEEKRREEKSQFT
jgi:hypothetical protein